MKIEGGKRKIINLQGTTLILKHSEPVIVASYNT